MILGISHSKVPIYFRTGPEHPTSNIEHRTSIACPEHADWMFDVGCWVLNVHYEEEPPKATQNHNWAKAEMLKAES
jgi:hypothetical protein